MTRIVFFILYMAVCGVLTCVGQNVTVDVVDRPAAEVFRGLMAQTGKNFVYPSEILEDMTVTLTAVDTPLGAVLEKMFRGTDIEYRIKKDKVVLKSKRKRRPQESVAVTSGVAASPVSMTAEAIPAVTQLDEVVVVSRLEAPEVETAEIGAKKITAEDVRNTPALLGENDVIKALHTLPGVTEGTEGLAGMHVHGGEADENLYMLDNVPVYHVDHFAGLFSAFNPDIIRYIDFFKSSVPAKYDGRLSSVMDVRLMNGDRDGHHGSARIGLTSASFNISGPIGNRTTYLVGLRRSWVDLITIPILALANADSDEKTKFHYYFMDLNAKVTHRFSNRTNAFVSLYFGNDRLKAGTKDGTEDDYWYSDEEYIMHWGNLVAQGGLNHKLNDSMTAELTAAYTRYFSTMKGDDYTRSYEVSTRESVETENNINDWIFRGDFDWRYSDYMRIRFGAGYTRHSFLPSRTTRKYTFDTTQSTSRDSTWTYGADAYIEDDWCIGSRLHVNGGVHLSMFHIDHKVTGGVSPRLSVNYRPSDRVAVKGAYTRTVQYVHQLRTSYLSLPTDQWVPVAGRFKPQTADKVSLGVYWEPGSHAYSLSAECYYKKMRHILDYQEEYYLKPPLEIWDARLTSGEGSAKGLDIKIEKMSGRITGHISYSLGWADRRFADKNGGKRFPARFDNRHTVNVLLNWKISDKVQLNASWTGHSGNRFTLLTQVWDTPTLGMDHVYGSGYATSLRADINNYQLPFYHRLDLSCMVRNKRGYWTFGMYNAYNHINTVAVRLSYSDKSPYGPVFQKVKFLPLIPSISYTWQF